MSCPKGSVPLTLNGMTFCHQIYYLVDPFWWLKQGFEPEPPRPPDLDSDSLLIHLKPDPTPWRLKPQPLPWKEALLAELAKIKPQPEPPPDIADIEVLATMGLLVEKLSPELREPFYKKLTETAKSILPDGVALKFGSLALSKQEKL